VSRLAGAESAAPAGIIGGGPTRTNDVVPFVELDRSDPELLEELVLTVERVAWKGDFILGHDVEAFERELAEYCETEHAVGVSSGTEALTLTLRALDLEPGSEVIVPANSFIATAEAVTAAGATPRIVDVDPGTHTLSAEIVEASLTPRTRCVIPVHLYGRTVDMEPLERLAREHGLVLVEDACQAHGARYRHGRVGSLGKAGCFSFYPAKNLGAWGDAGAVVTQDAALAERIRLLRSHGEHAKHDHRVSGGTARLDAIQAAILRVKLRRLDEWNDARRRVARELTAALAGSGVETPAPVEPGYDHVYHLYVVESDERDALREALARSGVATAVHYPLPIHLQPAYAHLGLRAGSLSVSERLAQRVLSLPLFPSMSSDAIERVAQAVYDHTSARSEPAAAVIGRRH
jgi:dTDP-4-amino-4,6-dideoxygalactose transaminase